MGLKRYGPKLYHASALLLGLRFLLWSEQLRIYAPYHSGAAPHSVADSALSKAATPTRVAALS